jgi:hypothetical protein
MRPHATMALSAVLDLAAAAALYMFDFRGFAAFMVAVAIVGFIIAYVMWKRSP